MEDFKKTIRTLSILFTMAVACNVALLALNVKLVTTHNILATSIQNKEANLLRVANIIKSKNKTIPDDIVTDMARAVIDTSKEYRITIARLLDIYHTESRMLHVTEQGTITLSLVGARGIAQIMPFWAKECPHSNKPSDLNYPSINIKCGGYILRTYLDNYDNDDVLALVAYNGGYRAVRAYLRGKPYRETTMYLKGILKI